MGTHKIYTDERELVLTVVGGKKTTRINVPCDSVRSVRFDRHKSFGLFGGGETERISISVAGRAEPVVYEQNKEKKFFEGYKKELEAFCKRNRVTFYNSL